MLLLGQRLAKLTFTKWRADELNVLHLSTFMYYMGVARIFQRGEGGGGHTVSNRGYSRFRNLNIVGCLRKKRLTKGGHGHPRTPP